MKRNRTKRGRAANGEGTLVLHRGIYHARWYANGKIISRSTGTDDLDEAREWLARNSVARVGARDRAAVTKLARVISASLDDADLQLRTLALPVRGLFELWRDDPARRPVKERTLAGYQAMLECLASWIERHHPEITSARDISQTIADEYARDRAKAASANRLNKHLNLFAAVWRSLARRHGLEYNPWSDEHIARQAHTPTMRRALTDAEVDALLAGSTGEMHLLVLLGISTGLRLADILCLRWADHIDLERGEIVVRRTRKTGAPVVLPMVPALREALEAAYAARGDSPWVLPHQHSRMRADGTPGEISHSACRLFRRCGVVSTREAPATYHSLRHTFVSRLMRRGVSPALVQAAVGHSSMMMTEHYTHISAAELKRGLGRIGAKKKKAPAED